MSFQAKDGKKFGNRQRQQKYDEMHSGGSGMKAEAENGDPQQAVAEHGPAKSIQVTSHNPGSHSLVAKHEDGHTHKSEHSTKAEAMDAARVVSGADEEASESPEFEAGEQEGMKEKPMMKSNRIPGV